jgi:serine/threonine protein phosphatase 1
MTKIKYKHTKWIETPEKVDISLDDKEIIIGDVHGQILPLDGLIKGLSTNLNTTDYNLTFLGDLVDRGPDSLGCLKLASEIKNDYKNVTRLLGNHELLMLYSILNVLTPDQKDYFRSIWFRNGGKKVVEEVNNFLKTSNDIAQDDVEAFEMSLGKEAWDDLMESYNPFANRPHKGSHKRVGNLIFAHAGIHPQAENVEDFFSVNGYEVSDCHWSWIRGDFLRFEGNLPENSFVIHGHTPSEDFVDFAISNINGTNTKWPNSNRICLDAGSFYNSIIMALEISNGMFRIHFSWDDDIRDLSKQF